MRPGHRHAITAALATLLLGGVAAAELKVIDGVYEKGEKPGVLKPPKVGGTGPEVHAETTGDATTSDTADEADVADNGSYAPEGGTTPSADEADRAEESSYAPDSDAADWAPEATNADTTQYAEDVAECAGGPLMGGACGPLRYDGRLGLETAPNADLDVAGTARLGTLSVGPGGNVGIGAQPGNAALTVAGTVAADRFVSVRTARIGPRTCQPFGRALGPADLQFDANGWVYSEIGVDDFPTTGFNGLVCPVPAEQGAVVTRVECDTSGLAAATWRFGAWDDAYATSATPPFAVGAGEKHMILVTQLGDASRKFGGCTVEWEADFTP